MAMKYAGLEAHTGCTVPADKTETPGTTAMEQSRMLDRTVQIVSAYVTHNQVTSSDLADLIRSVHTALCGLGSEPEVPAPSSRPAVSAAESVTPDYLVCLEDGRKLKMLRRYLRTRFDMTPDEYRAKWGLPADYPMVAPNYARVRSRHAKTIGLGRKR